MIDKIHSFAKREHIAVFGVDQTSKMNDEPKGHRPEDFLPEAKSMICFGIQVPYNVYCAPKYNLEMVWRSQSLLYRRLDSLSLRLSGFLESNGEKAFPVFGCMPLDINKNKSVVGYINQIRMAELTGIGVKGKNGLLLNSRFGARLMLGGLLTTATLAKTCYPDNEKKGCPPDCNVCSEVCPVNAIMPERKQLRIMRCLGYTAKTPFMSKVKFFYLLRKNKLSAARYMNQRTFDEHTFHVCSKCVSHCPYGSSIQ